MQGRSLRRTRPSCSMFNQVDWANTPTQILSAGGGIEEAPGAAGGRLF